MERIVLICNPAAGNKEMLDSIDSIAVRLNQNLGNTKVYWTSKPGDGSHFVRQIADQVDLVIAAGGDGTVHELVNAIAPLPVRPRLAILPGGTCNDFSRAIGMSQDWLEALDQILQQKERQIDIGVGGNRYFLNFWGIGLVTQVSAGIEDASKEKIGRLAYYLSAAQNILNHKPFHLSIRTDTETYQGEAAMVLVGNGSYLGGMQAFFPGSSLQDGLLDIMVLKEPSFDAAWSLLRSRISGNVSTGDDLLYFHTRHCTIDALPAQEIDCDGERQEHTPTTISALSQHLTFLTGDWSNT